MVAIAVLNTDRLVRLINDILDIERMAAGRLSLDPVALDVRHAARSVHPGRPSKRRHRSDRTASDIEPLIVLADSDRIVQAVVNLLGNAVKFSEQGSVGEVNVSRAGQIALFSVTDTGRGIPADRLESIFERFRQVDAIRRP